MNYPVVIGTDDLAKRYEVQHCQLRFSSTAMVQSLSCTPGFPSEEKAKSRARSELAWRVPERWVLRSGLRVPHAEAGEGCGGAWGARIISLPDPDGFRFTLSSTAAA